MASPDLMELSLTFAEVAANTEETWYLPVTRAGTWKVIAVAFASMTARTADATNHCVLTVSNAGTAIWTMTLDTPTTDDLSAGEVVSTAAPCAGITGTGTTLEFAQYTAVRVAKTDPGTGLALDGTLVVTLQQIPS